MGSTTSSTCTGIGRYPESVVLGIRSYAEILADKPAQAMQEAIRATKTLLFIGFGDGLADPNFDALMKWAREVFAHSMFRHYRLVRDGEVETTQKQHPPEDGVVVLGFGPDHKDLPEFLRGLAPPHHRSPRSRIGPLSRNPRPLPAHPATYCFGRDAEIKDLVATLLQDPPPPTPILGPPGIGKTTLTLAALDDPRVKRRFGARRYFVRCDTVTSREMLVAAIASHLGIEIGSGTDREAVVINSLGRGRAMLVLDNAETPLWDSGNPLPVEEWLAQLWAINGLAIVASIRGDQRPGGPAWREAIRVRPLPLEDARQAFLAFAGEKFRDDSRLDPLLEAMGRMPLAVALMAHAAEGDPDLEFTWSRWQAEKTAMLRRGKTRLTDLELSLELSISGPRMKGRDDARRLLALPRRPPRRDRTRGSARDAAREGSGGRLLLVEGRISLLRERSAPRPRPRSRVRQGQPPALRLLTSTAPWTIL